MANTGPANPESSGNQLRIRNTCWKAVVSRLGGWTFLYNTSPVAHSIGHPVIETHRGGLRQQRVLRQHVCGHGISCAGKAETSAFLASKSAKARNMAQFRWQHLFTVKTSLFLKVYSLNYELNSTTCATTEVIHGTNGCCATQGLASAHLYH